MKNWVEYLFIVLGVACIIMSIVRLLNTDEYFNSITGIIVGIGLVKAMYDKVRLKKEVDN
ncbi:MAG: hypothetical protein WBA16_08270 [Nonlabens sp.]